MELFLRILVVLTTLALVSSISASEGSSVKNAPIDQRIVGGYEASIRDFPYQIALLRDGRLFCGGSILNANTIITAAHCVDNIPANDFSIRAGSQFQGKWGHVVQVKESHIHKKYNSKTIDYDVAVLKLESPLKYDYYVKPIPLAESLVDAGTVCTVSGWGSQYFGGESTPVLRAVKVPIVSRSNCQSRYLSAHKITQRMICAGYSQGGKDACQGDNGGPLVYQNKLVGIVSWGIFCAKPGSPGVYTNVADSEIKQFIQQFL